jgi:hypothetical protein
MSLDARLSAQLLDIAAKVSKTWLATSIIKAGY